MSTPQPNPAERPDLRPRPAGTPWYRKPAAGYALVLLAVAAWLGYRTVWPLLGGGRPTDPSAAAPGTGPAAGQRPPTVSDSLEAASRESAVQARVAAAKVAQERVKAVGDEALTYAAEGLMEVDRWDAEVAPVLTSDAGRRVAARPELVKAFRAVYQLDRPARAEFESLTALATRALEPVRKAAANPADAWDATQQPTKALNDLRADALARRNAAREARRRVDLVLAAARRDAADPPADAPTLREAVRRLEEREAEELAAAVTSAREKARAEVQGLLAEQAAEAVRLAGKAEAAREAAKAEVARSKVELEAAALKAQAAKDRLRAKLATPEVQQDLAVFTAKGYAQPGPGGTGIFDKTDVFGPVSFTRLKTGGYLDPTPDGLKKLLRLGAEPALTNDRPKWKFNPARLDQSNEAHLKRVQALLTELGPVMVEDGLLAR